ncbi:MAG TPA: TolC family protein, partial [Nitrospira sp.]|nr:TolC family protein [Nitrospira sp.]
MRVGFVLVCAISLGLDVATASAQSRLGTDTASVQSDGRPYSLDMIIALALAKNPVVGLAEGNIEQQKGQQTAAGAYPNPTVTGSAGRGALRDVGRAGIGIISGDLQSYNESNYTINQPIEWPAMRAARQRAADLGLATANVGMLETRLNLASQVKVGFYDLLLAQQGADLARQNLDIVEGVARIVKARVKSGEAPQFESIKAEVEVLKARQQLVRADNLVRINRVAVDTLTGGALGPFYMIYGEFRIIPRDLHIEGLMARMVEQHPTIQRLLKSVEQSDWKIEFERQARVPNVTVNGGYWREIGREAYQGGLSVPVPLWYRRQGEIASSLGAKRREEAEL